MVQCRWLLAGQCGAPHHSSCVWPVAKKDLRACALSTVATSLGLAVFAIAQVVPQHRCRGCTGSLICELTVVREVDPRWWKGAALSEFSRTTVLAIRASREGASFRVQLDCRSLMDLARNWQRSSAKASNRLSLMLCCCFQTVTRFQTFRLHWRGPPTNPIYIHISQSRLSRFVG